MIFVNSYKTFYIIKFNKIIKTFHNIFEIKTYLFIITFYFIILMCLKIFFSLIFIMKKGYKSDLNINKKVFKNKKMYFKIQFVLCVVFYYYFWNITNTKVLFNYNNIIYIMHLNHNFIIMWRYVLFKKISYFLKMQTLFFKYKNFITFFWL